MSKLAQIAKLAALHIHIHRFSSYIAEPDLLRAKKCMGIAYYSISWSHDVTFIYEECYVSDCRKRIEECRIEAWIAAGYCVKSYLLHHYTKFAVYM